MSAEKFCLRWNDFEANISTAFRELREDKDFFDVTLACDDDQIQAHKVILSACSPFFRTVLRRNKHEHPLLYLKGVKYIDLVAVLNFMYHGEVNVAQEELNSFLAVAEDLKVKGLTQNGSDKVSSKSNPIHTPKFRAREPPERIDPAPHKRPRPSPQFSTPNIHQPISDPSYQDDDIQEVVPVKSEPVSLIPDPLPPPPISAPAVEPTYSNPISHSTSIVADPSMDNSSMYEEEYADYGNYEDGADGSYDGTMMAAGAATADGNKDLDEQIAKNMDKFLLEDGRTFAWQCLMCGRNNKDKSIVKHHVETHFPGYSQQCPYCNNIMRTRKSLKMHIIREHNGRKNQTQSQ